MKAQSLANVSKTMWTSQKTTIAMILLIFLVASNASAHGLGTRKVLVIGNDSYPGNSLKNARNDASGVAKAFASLGYSTTLKLDLNHSDMVQSVDRFANSIQPGDSAIFYYAGHGLQVHGENYLVPVDFKVTEPSEVKYQGVSLSSILEKLSHHGASTEIVILDACRNNPFSATRSLQGGWAGVGTSAGTFLAFGTSPGSTASDDPDAAHGLFTLQLLKYLTTSPLDVEQMFQEVRASVIEASNGHQVPWTASSLVGSFHFIPRLDMTAKPVFSATAADENGLDSSGRSLPRESQFRDPSGDTQDPVEPNGGDPIFVSGTRSQIYVPIIQRSIALAEEGHYDTSIRGLKAVLELDPRSALALRLLGLVFNLSGQRSNSIGALNRAIAVDPQDANAYYYRCLVLGTSDSAAAVRDCEASLGVDPDLAYSHLGLANALLALGQPGMAYSEASRMVKLAPNSPLGYAVRGKILARQGKREESTQSFARAISLTRTLETPE